MKSFSTRRGFFGAAGASLTAAGMPWNSFAADEPGDLKIGVATYSLRKFSRAQAIAIIRQLNVKYVSVKEYHLRYNATPAEGAEARKEFADAGLIIESGGNIDLRDPAKLQPMFDYAKLAGLPIMVCAPSHATLPAVEELVKEYNIKVAIHNHGPEDKEFPSPESVLTAIKGMDPRVGLCMDIGHASRAGADIVEWARKAGPRLLDTHFKDLKDKMAAKSQCPVGDGVLPIVEFMRTLKKMRYQGGLMLEYEIDADDPLLGMAKSIYYMKGVNAALRRA